MRITQIISHYVPAYRFGGPQQVAHGLGRAWVRQGHEVTVCTTNLADEHQDLSVPTGQALDVDGVTVFYEPTRLSRYWGYSPALKRRVRKVMEHTDLAIVHFHYQYANRIGAQSARARNVPYYVFAHGSFKRDAIRRRSSLKKSLYLNLCERRNLNAARHIVFNAEEERSLSLPLANGWVLPNAVDPAEYDALPQAGAWRRQFPSVGDRHVILYMGRLDYEGKGLHWLLPAFAQLVAEGHEVHLLIAGADERGGEKRIRQAVEQLGIHARVDLLGLVTGTDKLALLRDADMFVLPSQSEGLSIALLEALYVGLPVLVTDQVGLCAQIRALDAGIVTTADAAAVASGLRQLVLTYPQRRARATDWIQENYTWDAVARQLLRDFQKVN